MSKPIPYTTGDLMDHQHGTNDTLTGADINYTDPNTGYNY